MKLDCCDSPRLGQVRHLVARAKRDLYLKRCGCGAWWVHEEEDIWMGEDDIEYDTFGRLEDAEAEALRATDDPLSVDLGPRRAFERRGTFETELEDWTPRDILVARRG